MNDVCVVWSNVSSTAANAHAVPRHSQTKSTSHHLLCSRWQGNDGLPTFTHGSSTIEVVLTTDAANLICPDTVCHNLPCQIHLSIGMTTLELEFSVSAFDLTSVHLCIWHSAFGICACALWSPYLNRRVDHNSVVVFPNDLHVVDKPNIEKANVGVVVNEVHEPLRTNCKACDLVYGVEAKQNHRCCSKHVQRVIFANGHAKCKVPRARCRCRNKTLNK